MVLSLFGKLKSFSDRTVRSPDEALSATPDQPTEVLPLFPRWDFNEPLALQYIQFIIERYNALDATEKELASHYMVAQLVRNPHLGLALKSPYFQQTFHHEEIYLHLQAATLFGDGHLTASRDVLEHMVKLNSEPYNISYLASCYIALSDAANALRVVEQGLSTHTDHYGLRRTKALLLYMMHRTQEANAILDSLRPVLLNDPEQQALINDARKTQEELYDAVRHNRLYRIAEKDIYDEDYTLTTWWSYWVYYNAYKPTQHPFAWSSDIIQHELAQIIASDSSVKYVADFGVLCAEPLYRLAQQYPEVHFSGVDRSAMVKQANEVAYGALNNMTFFDGDVLDSLPRMLANGPESVFFHCRTACFLYPQHVRHIYQRCADLNVKTIVMFEATALSRLTYQYYDYADMPMDSLPNKGGHLLLHNYGKLLDEAGYDIVEEKRLNPASLIIETLDLGSVSSIIIAKKRS